MALAGGLGLGLALSRVKGAGRFGRPVVSADLAAGGAVSSWVSALAPGAINNANAATTAKTVDRIKETQG